MSEHPPREWCFYLDDMIGFAEKVMLRGFDKLEAVLKQLRESNPGDSQVAALSALYARAVSKTKTAQALIR